MAEDRDLCPRLCWEYCCCCCIEVRKSQKTTKAYPHIEYYDPEKAQKVLDMPEFSEVPLNKIFDFPQQARPFQLHPQVPSRLSPSYRGSTFHSVETRPRGSSAPVIVSQPRASQRYLSGIPKAKSFQEDVEMGVVDMSGRDHNLDPPFSPIPEDATADIETAEIPKIRFSLYYDIQRSVLTVQLFDAENIPVKGSYGGVDPFVVLFLLPAREVIHQSKVVKSSRNPHFNQVFEFKDVHVSQDLQQHILVLQIFDRDRASKDDLIGTVLVPLNEADLFGTVTVMKIGSDTLKTYSSGDLLLSLKIRPRTNTLSGIILKAANLPRPHIWGLADPYVKIYMVHKYKRVNKWKSTVKKNTLAPVFNETFEFSMVNMDVKDVMLEIFIMDRDKFSRNDIMGFIAIGLASRSETGRSHWSTMMSSPQQSISHWHNLLPRDKVARKKRHRHRSQSL